MAKTNNGNLLQHFVECQVANILTEHKHDLHMVCTHAMAPFETSESNTEDEFNAALRHALSSLAEPSSPWPVLRAYARSKASLTHYPNTVELIAA